DTGQHDAHRADVEHACDQVVFDRGDAHERHQRRAPGSEQQLPDRVGAEARVLLVEHDEIGACGCGRPHDARRGEPEDHRPQRDAAVGETPLDRVLPHVASPTNSRTAALNSAAESQNGACPASGSTTERALGSASAIQAPAADGTALLPPFTTSTGTPTKGSSGHRSVYATAESIATATSVGVFISSAVIHASSSSDSGVANIVSASSERVTLTRSCHRSARTASNPEGRRSPKSPSDQSGVAKKRGEWSTQTKRATRSQPSASRWTPTETAIAQPTSVTSSSPSVASTCRRSSAYAASECRSGVLPELPAPRRSRVTTRWSRARSETWRSQKRVVIVQPGTSTTQGPSPWSS